LQLEVETVDEAIAAVAREVADAEVERVRRRSGSP
jgi:hypothetical protein